jgi:uroporphyrinogen-III synthase
MHDFMNVAVVKNKETRKNLKRKKIIESAFQLFSRKSYHEVMMEDVARLSSIAKGTVYNYFSSKEELYFSIMKLRMEKLTTSLKENIKTELSSINALYSFIIHLYTFMMKYQNFFLMYRKETLKGEHELCSELLEMEKDYRNILSEIIKSGKQESLFRNINEDFAVELILGSIYGGVRRGIENNFVLKGLSKNSGNNMQPLEGKTIVLTRSAEQTREAAEKFIKIGAEVIEFPCLEIIPPESWKQFDEIVQSADKIDFLIFTSVNSVKMFAERIEELGIKFNFDGLEVIAAGVKTAEECRNKNVPVNIVPRNFSSHGLLTELSSYPLKGRVFFIPRSSIGRQELPEGLESLGAIVKTAPVYNVAVPSIEILQQHIEKLNGCKHDLFIFTSPSTFENFLTILNISDPKEYFKGCNIAAIGPTTKEAIEKREINVDIMPAEYSMKGLEEEIVKFYTK